MIQRAQIPGQSRALAVHSAPSPWQKVNFRPPDGLVLSPVTTPVWYTLEVHFDLAFDPKALGVKKGDKVAVQLLFCPNGWLETTPFQAKGLEAMDMEENPPKQPPAYYSETSNRVEFIYSGDPKHPMQ